MDKETLSNYGWIVICTLVLAVMIALASPFGEYISGAVKSTTQGLFDVSKNALSSAGIDIAGLSFGDDDEEFEDGMEGEDIDNSLAAKTPVKFGEKYIVIEDTENSNSIVGSYYIFYEDGSCTFSIRGSDEVTLPAGSLSYNPLGIINLDNDLMVVTENGTKIDDNGITLMLESEYYNSNITFGKKYICADASNEDVFGAYYIFYEDGSAEFYFDGYTDSSPAGTFSYVKGTLLNDGDAVAEISADGSQITIDEDIILTLETKVQGITFGQKYICTQSENNDDIGAYYIFYENGGALVYHSGTTSEIASNYFSYSNKVELVDEEGDAVGTIFENGTKISLADGEIILTLESEIQGIRFGEKYIITEYYEGDPDGFIGEYYILYEDGSAVVSSYGNEYTYPAGTFECSKVEITSKNDDIDLGGGFLIMDNGTELNLRDNGVILTLESEIHGLYFGEKYIVTEDTTNSTSLVGSYYIFHEDGSCTVSFRGSDEVTFPAGTFTYSQYTMTNATGEVQYINGKGTKLIDLDGLVLTLESAM